MPELSESTDTTASVVDAAAELDTTSADTAELETDSAASDTNAEVDQSLEAKPDDERIPLDEFQDDPFAEFNDKPLTTMEAVKMAFPRVSDSARERILDYGQKLDAALGQINEIGGEHGIAFAREITPLLKNPNPSTQEIDGVFQTLSNGNPALVAGMGQHLLDALLNDERTYVDTANKLITMEFGEGITLEDIHQLVGWKKADLFDTEAFARVAEERGIGKPTPYQEQLEARLVKAQEQIDQLTGKTNSAEQSAMDRAKAESDKYISDQLMEPIYPIAEKIGWVVKDGDKPEIKTAKLRLAEMVTAYLERETRSTPEYRNYEHLRDNKQTFGADGKPSKMLEINAGPLKGKSLALFIETAKELQPLINDTLRYKSTPRNGNKSEAATNGNTGQVTKPAVTSQDTTKEPKFNPKAVEDLDRQFVAARRDAQIPIGRR